LHLAASYATDSKIWTKLHSIILSCGNAGNDLGETRLHRAAAMSNITALRHIIDRIWESESIRHKLNAPDRRGRTPLWHVACTVADDALVVNELVDVGALLTADDSGVTPVHIAAAHDNNVRTLKVLVQRLNAHNLPAGRTSLLPSHMA
ncbi:hypothetical protein QBC35DRAFT_349232, partial [Podospora australis]